MAEKSLAARGADGDSAGSSSEKLCTFDVVRSDPETGRTVANYDCETTPLSLAVPALVAQVAGIDPLSLPPMYDCIDVDALERVVVERRHDDGDLAVSFRYAGYAIQVDAERLSVRPTE